MDLVGLAPMLAGGRLLLICPQAPNEIEAGHFSFSWSKGPRDSRQHASEIAASAALVGAFISDALERYPIDPERLAILGFSQGGMIAAQVALTDPGRFAGLALLSTSIDEERAGPLHAGPGAAELKVLIQHGQNDPTIPIVEAFATSMQLQNLGVKPELQQFPMEHAISQESAHSLSDWIEQVLHLEPSHQH